MEQDGETHRDGTGREREGGRQKEMRDREKDGQRETQQSDGKSTYTVVLTVYCRYVIVLNSYDVVKEAKVTRGADFAERIPGHTLGNFNLVERQFSIMINCNDCT